MESWAAEKYPTPLENAAALGGIRVVDQAIEIIEGYALEEEKESKK